MSKEKKSKKILPKRPRKKTNKKNENVGYSHQPFRIRSDDDL